MSTNTSDSASMDTSDSTATVAGHSGARSGRTRDATASKDALLQAAQTLFGQQGFEPVPTGAARARSCRRSYGPTPRARSGMPLQTAWRGDWSTRWWTT
jgi:hypothetical protein